MRLTITSLEGAVFPLEVSDDIELENVKAMCEMETGSPASQIVLMLNGVPLNDGKKLNECGVKDGDMLLLQILPPGQTVPQTLGRGRAMPMGRGQARAPGGFPQIDFGSIQIPGASGGPSRPQQQIPGVAEDPATIRKMLLSNPHELAILKDRNPPLAEALESGNLERFTKVLQEQQKQRLDKQREEQALSSASPFDIEAQRKIEDVIRQKNVDSQLESAMEYAPEQFGQVVMLYINCRVNGHPVKAFVDSGAQMTIMSKACAERCNIMRLVDTRWSGIAKGVGEQTILGRVHMGQIQIEKDFLQSSFSILKDQSMDMLLGLDMLKRHQCSIDLKNDKLVIGTTGTETTFLGEGDQPVCARLNRELARTLSQSDDQQMSEIMERSRQEAAAAGEAGTSGASASATASQPASEFPAELIAKVTSFGFSRQQAIDELRSKNGNVDEAIAALMAKSFSVPM